MWKSVKLQHSLSALRTRDSRPRTFKTAESHLLPGASSAHSQVNKPLPCKSSAPTCKWWHHCPKPCMSEELKVAKRLILEIVQRDTYLLSLTYLISMSTYHFRQTKILVQGKSWISIPTWMMVSSPQRVSCTSFLKSSLSRMNRTE